jgi:hypothetical protein
MKRCAATLTVMLVITSLPLLAQNRGVILSPFERRVLILLNAEHPTEENARELIGYGDQAYPIYERFLNDSTTPYTLVVSRILVILRSVPGSGSRFHGHALRRLADPHPGVRHSAIQFFERIGSREDAPPIVALLWDQDITVNRAAMEALSVIGGERELAALDLWAKSQAEGLRIDDQLRERTRKARDAIRQRVEGEKKGKAG